VIDVQAGLGAGVKDQNQAQWMANVEALMKVAAIFEMPAIITASVPDGPNGPVLEVVTENLPYAKMIARHGEIDAFDNEEFVTSVEALGVKKLIMVAITTDVCLTFAALSAKELGYDVYAVIDASGSFDIWQTDIAMQRMQQ